MTGEDFIMFVTQYRKAFLSPGEQWEFITTWEVEIIKRDLQDVLQAITAVQTDARTEARYPRQHLRILLSHADEFCRKRQPRERFEQRPFTEEEKVAVDAAWARAGYARKTAKGKS